MSQLKCQTTITFNNQEPVTFTKPTANALLGRVMIHLASNLQIFHSLNAGQAGRLVRHISSAVNTLENYCNTWKEDSTHSYCYRFDSDGIHLKVDFTMVRENTKRDYVYC